MPLTITDYKNWARQDQATTVSLTRDSNGIMAEKDRLGFLARTFGGSLKTVRAAVIKDFTRALSARYGSSIAQQAVSIAGLTPTTKLKGWKITEAIQAAKVLRAQMLMSGDRAPDIRLGDSDVPSEVTHFFLADKGNAVNKFLKQRATAVQLLGEMPLTEAEFSDFHARIGELAARLVRLKSTGVVPEGIPEADFRSAVDSLVAALFDKLAQVRETLDGNPLAEANLDDYKNIWRDAAANAMVELSEEAQRAGNAKAKEAIDHAISNLYGDTAVIQRFNDSIAGFSHDASKKYVAPFVVNLLRRQLAQEGVRNFRIGTADVVRRVDAGFQKNLNERPWKTIDKPILSSVGSRPVSLRSVIAPAEQLGRENPRDRSDRGLIASRYPARVHGYMCHCSTADHAVNLSVSSIAVGEPGGPQTVAFRGVRHGDLRRPRARRGGERLALGGLGGLRELRLLALGDLLVRVLRLALVGALLALEEALHHGAHDRADALPVGDAVELELVVLAGLARGVPAEVLDEAPVPGEAGVGGDDAERNVPVGAGAGESDFDGHRVLLFLVLRCVQGGCARASRAQRAGIIAQPPTKIQRNFASPRRTVAPPLPRPRLATR